MSLVTREEGVARAHDLGAPCYMECSAIKQQGIGKLIEESVRHSVIKKRSR